MATLNPNIPGFVVDGISSVATHNGLHRVTLFKHANGDKTIAESVELFIPAGVASQIAQTLIKLK
jgi:hypothetical protein